MLAYDVYECEALKQQGVQYVPLETLLREVGPAGLRWAALAAGSSGGRSCQLHLAECGQR